MPKVIKPEPKKEPKPTPDERKPLKRDPLTWQCAVCGLVTDLVVCPIDGNVSP